MRGAPVLPTARLWALSGSTEGQGSICRGQGWIFSRCSASPSHSLGSVGPRDGNSCCISLPRAARGRCRPRRTPQTQAGGRAGQGGGAILTHHPPCRSPAHMPWGPQPLFHSTEGLGGGQKPSQGRGRGCFPQLHPPYVTGAGGEGCWGPPAPAGLFLAAGQRWVYLCFPPSLCRESGRSGSEQRRERILLRHDAG